MPLRLAQSSGTSKVLWLPDVEPRSQEQDYCARCPPGPTWSGPIYMTQTSNLCCTWKCPGEIFMPNSDRAAAYPRRPACSTPQLLVALTSSYRLPGHWLPFEEKKRMLEYAAGMYAAASSLNRTLIMPGPELSLARFTCHAACRLSFVCPCPAVYAV